jgi:hypothetical protein
VFVHPEDEERAREIVQDAVDGPRPGWFDHPSVS